MASPKSSKNPSPVSPTAPVEPAPPGEGQTGQVSSATGSEGPQPPPTLAQQTVEPYSPPQTEEAQQENPSWIEIELVDLNDNPVPSEPYEVELPDGRMARGSLDHRGFARIEGIPAGTCKISFPNLDKNVWEPA